MAQYSQLASVYDWLVPDMLLEPADAVAAFGVVTDVLEPRSRVLDCAAGTGQLAVGLALRGHEVVASDASSEMVARTRDLAARHDVDVRAVVCPWDDLPDTVDGPFDAVYCVGNSLTHAVGRTGRRSALAAMRAVLREHGTLVVTSRNWERVRDQGSRLEVDRQVVRRAGRTGLPLRVWTIPSEWGAPHHLDVAVAIVDGDGGVDTIGERLTFWPFTHEALDDDLRTSGFEPTTSTYTADADRYLVTARAVPHA